jgi:hypothetical protein
LRVSVWEESARSRVTLRCRAGAPDDSPSPSLKSLRRLQATEVRHDERAWQCSTPHVALLIRRGSLSQVERLPNSLISINLPNSLMSIGLPNSLMSQSAQSEVAQSHHCVHHRLSGCAARVPHPGRRRRYAHVLRVRWIPSEHLHRQLGHACDSSQH